jgi:hypothetical protein
VSERGDSIDPLVFVLVHGAWHGSWCWRRVAEGLRGGGHLVFTPTFTGLGERSHREPIRLNHPLGNGIRKTYIACVEPAYGPLVSTHERVRRQSGWEYLEFASGHDAMVISPDALTELLVRCASDKS